MMFQKIMVHNLFVYLSSSLEWAVSLFPEWYINSNLLKQVTAYGNVSTHLHTYLYLYINLYYDETFMGRDNYSC